MRAATTPSRRERSSPPVRPKIEQVFTSANTHRHRTPHLGNHAAHTAMVTGQHQGTGSAHEHRATTTRATAPASKTSTPPHPRPVAPQRKRRVERSHLSHPWATPSIETQRSAKTGIHRPVLLPRARDKLSPTTSRGGRGQSCCTVHETSSVLPRRARDELGPAEPGHETSGGPQLGEDQPFEESSIRTPRRGIEGQNSPPANKLTPAEKPTVAAAGTAELPCRYQAAGRPPYHPAPP